MHGTMNVKFTLKARLNGKVVGRTEMDNLHTENGRFTVFCLVRDQLQFLNNFIGNTVAKLRSVDQLHCLLIVLN